jgi:hypothetical protein
MLLAGLWIFLSDSRVLLVTKGPPKDKTYAAIIISMAPISYADCFGCSQITVALGCFLIERDYFQRNEKLFQRFVILLAMCLWIVTVRPGKEVISSSD